MLKLTLFGQFSIKTATKQITEESLHAPRVFRAMVYLFANRNRRIPLRDFSAFLHEGKQYASPVSYSAGSDSLVKTTLHRIRAQLKPLQEEEPQLELIVQDGAIRFAPDLVITTDVDRFDEVYTELSEKGKSLSVTDPDRALFLFHTTFSLYKGKYLAAIGNEDFSAPLAKAYHEKYIALCEEYFPILYHTGKLDELIRMTSEGIAIDPFCETFHYFKIRAIAERGERALALSLYEGVERLFDSQFHVNPSAKLRNLRRTLTLEQTAENADEALSAILAQHKENEAVSSETFASLLVLSQKATCGYQEFSLLTVDKPKHTELAEKHLKTHLSPGEFFCQFSNCQFAILCSAESVNKLKEALSQNSVSVVLESIPVPSVFSIKNSVNN